MRIPINKAIQNIGFFHIYTHHDNELYILRIYSGFKYEDM